MLVVVAHLGACLLPEGDNMEKINFDKLLLLLKAPSKEFVVRLCDDAFMLRSSTALPSSVTNNITKTLSLQSDAEAAQLITALSALIKHVVFLGSSEASEFTALFPGDFNKSLSALLVKVFVQKLPTWKQVASNSSTFLPQLIDFDWRVDINTSSDCMQRMSVPVCFLQMQIQEPISRSDVVPPSRCETMELTRQTLDTMIDGLRRIRDQLSSVAAK